MLENSPLAQHLAVILTDIRAGAAHQAARNGAVAALHALILAALARLLARFENVLAHWQSGQLAPSVPAGPAPAHPPSTPRDTTAPQIRPLRSTTYPRRPAPAVLPAPGAPAQPRPAPCQLPRNLSPQPPHARQARSQPPNHNFCFSTPFKRHREPTTKLLHYRN